MSDDEQEVEPSLRETLEAAVVEHAEPVADKPTEEAAPSTDRDEAGKFKAKSEPIEAVAAPIPPPANIAPEKWPADRKEKFAKLTHDAQAIILEREKEVELGFTKLDEDRNFGKQIKEIVTPYLPIIKAEGGTPDKAIHDLLNTAYVLRTGNAQQKAALVMQVIQQYGVDVRLMGQPQQQQPASPVFDKDSLKRELMEDLQTQQSSARIASELQEFSADPKNVHFANPDVKAKMASLLGAGQAKDYQDAYDQAIWTVPGIRSTLIAAQQPAPQDEKRKQEIAAKKNAGSSVSGSPGPSVPNSGNPNRDLREELRANMNALMN